MARKTQRTLVTSVIGSDTHVGSNLVAGKHLRPTVEKHFLDMEHRGRHTQLPIRNYQHLDRPAAMYQAHGVELHRRQPGFLTGTSIPPSIAVITCVLDGLLAAAQSVKNYGLEMGKACNSSIFERTITG